MTPDTAFNQGADARIAGLPRHANPHRGLGNHDREAWARGWEDADRHWGENARWWVRQLPKVRQ